MSLDVSGCKAEEMIMLVMGKPPHQSIEITESDNKLTVNPFSYESEVPRPHAIQPSGPLPNITMQIIF